MWRLQRAASGAPWRRTEVAGLDVGNAKRDVIFGSSEVGRWSCA